MAFDIIGNIAIIQSSRDKSKKKIKTDALKLIKAYKHIESVYFKEKISGRLRTPKLIWTAGKRKTEVLYRENGCLFKLDVKKCYFSPRLSTDRKEIAKKVKPKEKVLVLFSGAAPYGIVIAKHSRAESIWCVELGRTASKYAQENVKLNKLDNIEIIQGDVKRILPKFSKKIKVKTKIKAKTKSKPKFDRIVMARPQLKETFLKEAFLTAKKGTIIHFYDFLPKVDFPKASVEKIKQAAKKAKKKIRILKSKKVREIAPYKYHVRIDFKTI